MISPDLPGYGELVRLGLVKPEPRPDMSLAEARAYVRAGLDVGVTCPCCRRFAKRYARKLNSGMARALISLATCKPNKEGWRSIRDVVRRLRVSPEMSKLRWWGLVEDKPHIAGAKRASGLWRLTDKGAEFLHGRSRVQSHAVVSNNELERLEGEPVAIWDALGEKFNYLELMAGVPGFTSAVA